MVESGSQGGAEVAKKAEVGKRVELVGNIEIKEEVGYGRMMEYSIWQELMKLLGTSVHLSIAYHIEFDGQSERPKTWAQWLPLAKWWYNSSYHFALKMTPFQAFYGYTSLGFLWDVSSKARGQGSIREKGNVMKLYGDHIDMVESGSQGGAKVAKKAEVGKRIELAGNADIKEEVSSQLAFICSSEEFSHILIAITWFHIFDDSMVRVNLPMLLILKSETKFMMRLTMDAMPHWIKHLKQ
ncbi:uncharacterized protein LOC111283615 [Durio zibethinus]|uniref:Uncharacterized protein LOC111283615 n=1 Tax=Durio zibethinus TaxID=66656 RepID=A0A6P5XJC9_DURZI|nr:uncharacterized protein LOC111283615 [Durio zibethinus]